MQIAKQSSSIKKVSNVQKNFLYQCEICFQDYDTTQHIPMIICSNYHAICSKCVESNLFKKEYNGQKNHTGRYMCSKCSQIINKDYIREHNILKEVCNYIKVIRQRDQYNRKQFYQYVGSMGMNLVAMRQDFDGIEKNNIMLKKQNQLLIKQNCKLRDEYLRIEKASGALQELEKVQKELQKVKMQSIKEQIDRKNKQFECKRSETLDQTKRFYQLQSQLKYLIQQIKRQQRKSRQLMQNNEGAINLRQYLQQQINNLQNDKKRLQQQNINKKQRINKSIKIMQNYWDSIINNDNNSNYNLQDINTYIINNQNNKENNKENNNENSQNNQNNQNSKENNQSYKNKISKFKQQEKKHLINQKQSTFNSIYQQQPKKQYQLQSQNKHKIPIISYFDHTQKSIKNFQIQDSNIVTLLNPKLSSFVHISLSQPFNLNKDHQFTIKLRKLQSQQIMIGLMTTECKNKKNIYNRKGFYAIDAFSKLWSDGISNDCKMTIKQGDQITVKYIKEAHVLQWSKAGNKIPQQMKLSEHRNKSVLYPVILLIQDRDSFELLQVKS